MDDEMLDRFDPGSMEVLRRLEAYADARLTPSAATTTGVRATVMAAAHRRSAMLAVGAPVEAASLPRPRFTFRFAVPTGAWRRPAAAMLAGGLVLGLLAGAAFAAQPGGWLYGARMWTEAATLPSAGLARAQAEVGRLEARLREAQAASAAGDVGGVEAAIAAYESIVAEAMAGSAGDPLATAALEAGIARHVAILTALASQVPLAAQDDIQHALAASTKVLDRLDDGTSPTGTGGSGSNGGNSPTDGKPAGGSSTGGSGSSAGGSGGAGAAGGAAPTAEPTAKPPKPTPPGHDRTPRPARTATPTAPGDPGGREGDSDPNSDGGDEP